jgi:hypothetical protein
MQPAGNVVSLEQRRERIKLECSPSLFPPVRLVADDYELAYVGHQLRQQFGRGVLACFFVLADHWPKDAVVVARYYKVVAEKGGKWRPAKHGALVTEFRQLFPYRRLPRLDRFPLTWLHDQHVVGRIGTVERDHEQKALGESAVYSVVRELLRCSS